MCRGREGKEGRTGGGWTASSTTVYSLGVMASTIHNTRRLERTGIIRLRDTRPGRTEIIRLRDTIPGRTEIVRLRDTRPGRTETIRLRDTRPGRTNMIRLKTQDRVELRFSG